MSYGMIEEMCHHASRKRILKLLQSKLQFVAKNKKDDALHDDAWHDPSGTNRQSQFHVFLIDFIITQLISPLCFYIKSINLKHQQYFYSDVLRNHPRGWCNHFSFSSQGGDILSLWCQLVHLLYKLCGSREMYHKERLYPK